ncbi:MAG: gliding motility-associated C-terminal domain-containing protein [Bacteroidales bacterium]|nr:gliding motility-associated C-terminal domain-containing protein [Bacteroidales bacterium]
MKRFVPIIMLLLPLVAVQAQGDDDCPGFRNITTFETDNSDYYWTAREGYKYSSWRSGDDDTTTGYHIISTCVTARDIPADSITDPVFYSPTLEECPGVNPYHYTGEPDDGRSFDFSYQRFTIIDQDHVGLDDLTVDHGTGLPRIPPGYMTSIRLGDMYAGGACNDTTKGAEAIYYHMKVTPSNAMMIINYAIVTRKFSHTAWDAGEFIIRVVAQNLDGTWPNEPINDNLWYKVCAPRTDEGLPAPWVEGLDNGSPEKFCYKPWAKVAINLNDYLFRKVRVEMYTSDCCWQYDCLYAYICGDFQPMIINTVGCPDMASNVVDTLTAPDGLLSYQWYVVEDSAVADLSDTSLVNNASFRIIPGATNRIYTPHEGDFVTSTGDTVAEKTFRCVMTSALDPNKPFETNLHANSINRKPHVEYSFEYECGRRVNFHDASYSFYNDAIAADSTSWIFYEDTLCTRPIDTVYGIDVSYKFRRSGKFGVKHCVLINDYSCGAQSVFVIDVPKAPEASIFVNEHYLCDGELAEVRFHSQNSDDMYPSVKGREIPVTALDTTPYDFYPSLGPTPLRLIAVSNLGCSDTTYDTIYAYGTPRLTVDPPSGLICKGQSATITATGVPTYDWYSSPADTSLASQQGQPTVTVSPDTTTVYFVKAVSIPRCDIHNQSAVIEIVPWPRPAWKLSNPYINFDYPSVSIEDVSQHGHHTFWELSDGTTYTGSVLNHVATGIDVDDELDVTMTTCNRANCCNDTSFSVPVKLFSHWFPNAFTPSRDENNRFGVQTNMPLAGYELYIYNRYGLLVFSTTDPAEGWDGTYDGKPCPQGGYAYVYKLAFDNNDRTVISGHGSITLIR